MIEIERVKSYIATRMFKYILIGLIIRLILSLFARHSWDFWLNYETIKHMWKIGGLSDIYVAGQQMMPDGGQIWYYGIFGTLAVSWPPLLVGDFNSSNPLHVFLGHLPYLLFELLSLALVLYYFEESKKEAFLIYIWLNPFWIFLNYCYAQIDIIGASLGMAAVVLCSEALTRAKEFKSNDKNVNLLLLTAGFLCGLAIHVKTGHLISLSAVFCIVLLNYRNLRFFLRSMIYIIFGFMLSAIPLFAIGNEYFNDYWVSILGGPTGRLFSVRFLGISTIHLIFIIAILLIILIFLLNTSVAKTKSSAKKISLSSIRWNVFLTEALIACILAFYFAIDFHPHWMVWTMPVWMASIGSSKSINVMHKVFLVFGSFVLLAYDQFTFFRTFDLILSTFGSMYFNLVSLWDHYVVSTLSIETETGLLCSFLIVTFVFFISIAYEFNEVFEE